MQPFVKRFAASTVSAGLAAALAFGAAPANAQRPFPSLLGVRVWSSTWKDVLKRYGQPTRVEVGASAGAGGSQTASGGGMGPSTGGMGAAGLPGLPGMGPGGGKMGMMSGMGGPPGGMGGYAAMMQQSMRGSMGGRAPQNPYGGGMPGGGTEMGGPPAGFGLPSMPGAAMGSGGPGMSGLGAAGGGGEQAISPEDEVTWVYERGNKKSPNVDLFLFNRSGRLIQIQSFGYANGAVTSKGIKLGDPVIKIFHDYGWTGNMTKDQAGGTMMLDYGKEHGIAFQLLDRHNGLGFRVVGITAAITNPNDIPGNRTEDEESK